MSLEQASDHSRRAETNRRPEQVADSAENPAKPETLEQFPSSVTDHSIR